jgi:hypothetical protein
MAGHMTTETTDSFSLPVERGDTVLIKKQDAHKDSIYSKHEIHAITDTALIRTTNGTYGKAEFMRMIKEAGEIKIEYE